MFRFPFTNFHELNLDWILSVVKEAKAVFDNGREDIDYAVATADEAKEIAQQAAESTIPDNSVTTPKIRDYAITSDKIATFAVTTDKIQEGGVTNSKLADNTITAEKLSFGNINRQNLLDNWYFIGVGSQLGSGKFPINQRCQLLYENQGYSIDRWKHYSANAKTSILTDYVKFSSSDSNRATFMQYLSQYIPLGSKITLSVLFKDGSMGTATDTVVSSGAIATVNLNNFTIYYSYSTNAVVFTTADADIVAIKLEIGNSQTLAYKNHVSQSPEWLLNDTPNFADELYKCKRYYQKSSPLTISPTTEDIKYATMVSARNNATVPILFPVEMAKTPVITKIGQAFCYASSSNGSEGETYNTNILPAFERSTGFSLTQNFFAGFAVFGLCWTASAED